jgi:integrase
MVSEWLGHSQRETTAIYTNAVDEEQQTIAARTWT